MHGCYVFMKIIYHLSKCLWFWCSNFIIYDNIIGILMCNSHKHDVIKRKLYLHENAIETRQEGIGAPKVKKKYYYVCFDSFIF